MADYAASRRRLMATYRNEKRDRVPICSPISWNPLRDIDREKPAGWRAEPGFIDVARMVQDYCDPRPPYNPVGYPNVFSRISYQRFLEAPDEYIETLHPEKISDIRTRYGAVLHTPKGDLAWIYDEDEGIETRWDMQKPISSPDDVEKMLSVPFHFNRPDSSEYEPFRKHRAETGPDCISGIGIISMVGMLCGMMSFEMLLEWVLAEPALIKALADAWLERTWQKIDFLLSRGVGPFWDFCGVERASPPMMGPRQWEQWVVPYDGEIMRRIRQRDPDAVIHVHCHGRVGTLLDSFMAMGVDSIDPVEPPPQGDVVFADAKKRSAGRMTLYGNIEFSDMELCSPDEIEEKVRSAILDGGPDHVVLHPSSVPHQQHNPRFTENARRYIQAAVKYGAL
ncbi:MAG: hypothetical protein JW909_07900 [Planctomycetes bacterium]|nr:hypothetical protein [Planctomycetota bacterium]